MVNQIEELKKETIKNEVNTCLHKAIFKTPHDIENRLLKRIFYRCGNDFPHTSICLALGKICYSCGNIGHFTTVCKSKK